MKKLYYSIDELAKLLGKHRNTILRWIKAEELKAHKPKKEYIISRKDIDTFLNK